MQSDLILHADPPDPEPDLALHRIFDRIGQQIHQYLPDSQIIPEQFGRQPRIHFHDQLQFLLLGFQGIHVKNILERICQAVCVREDLHLPRFDLSIVQNIVDNPQQCLCGILNIPGVPADILILALPPDHLIHTENGIDRRSNLMGHPCQEFCLRLIGLIRICLQSAHLIQFISLLRQIKQEQ